ncbi:MAG: hypothetical protein C0513_00975 [Isosphaera sp.]|nr:hypothetical protein [Isosphaera sp.]
MSQPSATPFEIHADATGPHAGIGVIRLDQSPSPMVVLDAGLIGRIEATLAPLVQGGGVGGLRGLVVASASPRVFIAGADLKSIQALSDAELGAYLERGQRVFGMLSGLPVVTAAAIHGAVLGGGLELAMHCDGLIGCPSGSGKPYPVGLPEAGLSICPGWGGTNLLPARMDPAEAIRRTAAGRPMQYEEAVSAGVFDRVAQNEAGLIETAKAWVLERGQAAGVPDRARGEPSRWIGAAGVRERVSAALDRVRGEVGAMGEPARAVLGAVSEGLARGWQGALGVERRELVRLRSEPAGRAAIQAFFERSAKK